MTENGESHSFQCPKLGCAAQYVALLRDDKPDTPPRCLRCDTPFLAQEKGKYVYYQSLWFD